MGGDRRRRRHPRGDGHPWRALSTLAERGRLGGGDCRRRRRVCADSPAALRSRRDAARSRCRCCARRVARAYRSPDALRRRSHDRRLGRLVLGLMPGRRFGLGALLLGLLAAALLHGRLGAHPIYDGIVVPPAPYRYESPPPNLANGNQPPLGGQATLPAPNGKVAGGGVQTDDQQVITFWGLGTLKAPAGASSVMCTIQPVANPPAPPAGMELRGNVYAIKCVGQPGNGEVTASTTFHLTMRIPPGTVNDIRYYDGQSWHNLTTLFAGGGD